VQAGLIQQAIARALGAGPDEAAAAAPLVTVTTSGDRIQDRRLAEIGGKGLFTKEIEEALLAGRIDCAVHSLKDMPAELPPGLVIGAVPAREDPRDVLVARSATSLAALPRGARLGTSSLRRQAQALHARPDLEVVSLRGNVDTRLRRFDDGEFDAIVTARAALLRLGLERLAAATIDPREAPPAPGQGALAVEVRAADLEAPWLAALRDPAASLAVAAERGALLALEGSCRTAVGAYARFVEGRLRLTVEALTPDGAARFRREGEIAAADGEAAARALGLALGAEIRAEGGARLEPA